ncbi:Origin recognition complex subunit 3 [Neocucurbitaria cava]|uniref:Origin recognition complex subunit 3 n=1 Tax=Neocucurbitaria cava TaxID=798079 RepID=A0A9W9CNC4_9PLEO|nr:Origin recognition complex subunit 3 [Neocucurbitaria cava]
MWNSLRYLEGEKFDVTQSDDIIEKLFSATVASPDTHLRVGPNLCRRMLDRQKDHVQNTQDFCDGLKYAYMSHFYASYPALFLKDGIPFEDLPEDAFEAVRNLPSFRRWVEEKLEQGQAQEVRQLLNSNQYLFDQIESGIESGQQALSTLSHASQVLTSIRESLQVSPKVRLSSVWTRGASGELASSPLLRETMLCIKKIPSDRLVQLLASMEELQGDYFSVDITTFQQQINDLLENADTNAPLRTQHDVRNDSLRTTVVAQKVLLSKHKAALSEQDKAYSDLVGRFHDELEQYFAWAFIDPRTLFLSEILIYDLKSPHTEVFQPKPRLAIERALASPHDYLGCDCCSGVEGNEAALSATQPATAIVYQMYLESGTLINVSDLWSAFNAIAGDGEEESESKTMSVVCGLVHDSHMLIDIGLYSSGRWPSSNTLASSNLAGRKPTISRRSCGKGSDHLCLSTTIYYTQYQFTGFPPSPRTSRLWLRCGIAQRPTVLTRPRLLIRFKTIHRILNLRAQIRAVKRGLMHLLPTALTVPPQPIQTPRRPLLLQHHTHRILEAYGVMRCIRREQEHVSLVDVDVAELLVGGLRLVYHLEEHGAFVLVEPFCRLVDVVVGALVGAAYYHYGYVVVVYAVVVDGRFEHVGVF